jgi:hypothetical protein
MQRLLSAVVDEGRFEGMAGTLLVIRERFFCHIPEDALPLSPTSRYALSDVSAMLNSTAKGDEQGFLRSWENLIGLGPGLTPSADDMLVGFMASQKMLSTPFWEKIELSGVKSLMKKTAKDKTTPIAAAILCHALDGHFSEMLYHVFENLADDDPYRVGCPAINNFFRWGHSSGTDTLVGVVLGLSTLC